MKFGFEVVHHTVRYEWDRTVPVEFQDDTRKDIPIDQWEVRLPHQCDEWQITGEGEDNGVSHEEAVRLLEAFLDEAAEALNALYAKREFGRER